MKAIEAMRKLVDDCQHDEKKADAELMARDAHGNVFRVNAIVWQEDAQEWQIFIAPT